MTTAAVASSIESVWRNADGLTAHGMVASRPASHTRNSRSIGMAHFVVPIKLALTKPILWV
jgi:hypothetical protein